MFSRSSSFAIGAWLAFAAALGFSLKAIFVKLGLAAGAPPLVLLAWRMLLSLPVFVWISYRHRSNRLTRREYLQIAGLGLLGYYLSSLLDFLGLQYISAALERLILFTYPTLTLLISSFWLGHQLHRREVVALALTYAGIALAVGHDLSLNSGDNLLLGVALVAGSSLSYALYLSFSPPLIAKLGSRQFTALAMLVSASACVFHAALAHPLSTFVSQTPAVYAYALAMALFSTVLPVFMQTAAVERIGAPTTVLISSCGPVLTILVAAVVLSEPMGLLQWLGTSLVLAGALGVRAKGER